MVFGKSGSTHIPHIHLRLLRNKQMETYILKEGGKYDHHFQLWVYRFLSEFVHIVLLCSLRSIPMEQRELLFWTQFYNQRKACDWLWLLLTNLLRSKRKAEVQTLLTSSKTIQVPLTLCEKLCLAFWEDQSTYPKIGWLESKIWPICSGEQRAIKWDS